MARELSPAIRERRRDRILEVATRVFFEEGFAAATMSTISARLGGSKATLYAYFPNKETLFEAIIQRQCELLLRAIDEAGSLAELRGQLTHLGLAFVGLLVSEPGVRTMQLSIEGSRNNPALAHRFEQVGVRAVTERLVSFLGDASARGELSAPDPLEAARTFISLMRGDLHFRRLLNLIPEPSPKTMRLEVDRAIDIFLRAYPQTAR